MFIDSDAGLVATYQAFLLGKCVHLAMSALIFYEHLITFKYEVDFLWRRKWSAATWIFVCNRYLLLARVVFMTVPVSPKVCGNTQAMNFLTFLTTTIPTVPTHAFTILRIFALLQNHSWTRPSVTWIVVTLSFAVLIKDTYVTFTKAWIYANNPSLGPSCYVTGFFIDARIIQRVNTAGTVIAITIAVIALIVTLMTTVRQVQQAAALRLKTTLSEILLRDGSMFFLLILAMNITVALPIKSDLRPTGHVASVMMIILSVLCRVSLSRFIINLRQVDMPASNMSTNRHLSRYSMPNFRMPTLDDVVGNIGEPLDFVEYRIDDTNDMYVDRNGAQNDHGGTDEHQSSPSTLTAFTDPDLAVSFGSVQVDFADFQDMQCRTRGLATASTQPGA